MELVLCIQRLTICQALDRSRLMTAGGARVCKCFPRYRDKPPCITICFKSQLQYTMCGGIAHLAAWVSGAETIE